MNNEEITNYIFLNDENPQGDIALVFGTWGTWQEPVAKAAELYQKRLVPKVIVSQGANPSTGVVEGDLMAEELAKLGVPSNDILIENKAKNTLDNVLFSKEIIDKKIGLQNIHTLVAVVRNFHARRALMTLKKHFPQQIKVKVLAYESKYYPFTKDNWSKTDVGREVVMGEVKKIQKYLAKGDLAEL